MVEPDLEAIAALEPDLIIASPRTQKFVDKFKEIPTVLFQTSKGRLLDFYQSQHRIPSKRLWRKQGKRKPKNWLTLDKSIQEVATKNESSDKKLLAILLNEGKMAAFGAQSRSLS